jgi:hypothetical protein
LAAPAVVVQQTWKKFNHKGTKKPSRREKGSVPISERGIYAASVFKAMAEHFY